MFLGSKIEEKSGGKDLIENGLEEGETEHNFVFQNEDYSRIKFLKNFVCIYHLPKKKVKRGVLMNKKGQLMRGGSVQHKTKSFLVKRDNEILKSKFGDFLEILLSVKNCNKLKSCLCVCETCANQLKSEMNGEVPTNNENNIIEYNGSENQNSEEGENAVLDGIFIM